MIRGIPVVCAHSFKRLLGVIEAPIELAGNKHFRFMLATEVHPWDVRLDTMAVRYETVDLNLERIRFGYGWLEGRVFRTDLPLCTLKLITCWRTATKDEEQLWKSLIGSE